MKPLFAELVRQKACLLEGGIVPRIPELDEWIEEAYQEVEASIPSIPSFDKPSWGPYDHAFLDVLNDIMTR